MTSYLLAINPWFVFYIFNSRRRRIYDRGADIWYVVHFQVDNGHVQIFVYLNSICKVTEKIEVCWAVLSYVHFLFP